MPALTTRAEARERLTKLFLDSLDRIIPPDEARPLKGSTFLDFEGQADQLRRALLPALLEERAALEPTAHVEAGGHCPHCGSDAVWLERAATRKEVISPHGPVLLSRQRARCRCCDRSFSPSGAGVGPAGRGAADADGGPTPGPRGGGPTV
jgi:hypothetical protein